MQVRMGERLQVRLDLPDELAGLPVPPLLLQPLVENAIKHGLEPQHRRRPHRDRRVDARDSSLVLRVRDTGAGLAAPQPGGSQLRPAAGARAPGDAVRRARPRSQLAPAADADGGTLATVTLPIAP